MRIRALIGLFSSQSLFGCKTMAHVFVNWEEKYVELREVYPNDASYDISFRDLVGLGLEHWISHLQEKVWWSQSLETHLREKYPEIEARMKKTQ